ncbi:HD domain-containing protein [Aquimarina sediminis]|uniref:HD domain-containing protein n=1 Tax=Aquimarina sediminis TaxID=2070536 RepID=UPI000CA02A58|nr:hypothetical protein [Aquimarina sediminis]
MLKNIFTSLITKYTNDQEVLELLWVDISKTHSQKNRHYHNLSHLENLFQNLIMVQDKIKDWDIVLFALFYHDYVYNARKQNNEEKSAQKAVEVLNSLSIDKNRVALCSDIILATKGHHISENQDVNYFTDADLSILGSDWKYYEAYFKNVRKEYKYYPDFIYNNGRIKVLNHFIDMPAIFKTNYFNQNLEVKAKRNLQQEIDLLSK